MKVFRAALSTRRRHGQWRAPIVALLFCCVCFLSAYAVEPSHHELDFHKYDDLTSKEAKEAAALRDLSAEFPPGSPTDQLVALFSQRGNAAFCEERTYIPPTDKAALSGNHTYCELNYRDPKDKTGVVAVKWSIDIKSSANKQLIEEIKVFWARSFIGG